MIQVNHQQKRKISMKCKDIQCLLTVHLMKKNNKLDYYRGKDCLKRFCQDLKKQATSIIDFGMKKIIELTQEEHYRHDTEKKSFICEKPFFEDAKIIILK